MWLHACWCDTSELSCFPKYMSEEMAFISPNLCWASPVFVTGSFFLLAVGLKTNQHVWKQNQCLTVLISIKTTERCTCHALMWWWESRRSQARASRSPSSSPFLPLRLPIGRKNDPGFDPQHDRSSFRNTPRDTLSVHQSLQIPLTPEPGSEPEPSWYEANTYIWNL